MEPFGLLNLLKSLLPQTENSTENSEKSGDNLDNGGTTPKTENDCLPKKENPPPTFAEEPQNAFLDFVNRHDARKKNIKKP